MRIVPMKNHLIRNLFLLAIVSVALSFSAAVFGEEPDMLKKALDLVHQAESSTVNSPSDVQQRTECLTQALKLTQDATQRRLGGHRVKAVQAIKAALSEIQAGDVNHKAIDFIHDADSELSTAVSLAGTSDPGVKNSNGSPSPATATSAITSATPPLPAGTATSKLAPIAEAAKSGDLEKVKALVQANPDLVFYKDSFEMTPLHMAAAADHKEVVEFLLANKADVNAVDETGETPLHLAVMGNKKGLVELLLANGADVNSRNKKGDPLLYETVSMRAWDDMAKVLVANKADVTAKGHDGLTPLQVAIKYDDDDMANVLRHPEIVQKNATSTPIDLTAISAVTTRLVSNASKKPPGPVEDDITEQSLNSCNALKKGFKDSRSIREMIAGEYNKFTVESPLTLIYSEGIAAIVSADVKMTPTALDDWKNDPPFSSTSVTVKGKEVTSNEIGVMFGEPGGCQLLESKVRDDGHVVATFCLLQQHGNWKVHCVALSNNPLKKHDIDFFSHSLVSMANKPGPAETPSGYFILHHFGDSTVPHDGCNPRDSLYQLPGSQNLYGVTQDKGNPNSGTIYKITPYGEEMVLHVFSGTPPNADGTASNQACEYSLTLGFGGGFRGVTNGGGQYNGGTVFSISQDGTFKTLYEFGNPDIKDGPRNPNGPLLLSTDSNLYGVSASGGSAGHGTIFKVTPRGIVTTVHSFGDGAVANEGESPRGALLWVNEATYYGATSSGAHAKDAPDFKGSLFATTTAGKVTVLHRFVDGTVPNDGNATGKVGLFRTLDGSTYGTTEFGGANNAGTFFKFTPEGAVTILHSFGDQTLKDGSSPQPNFVEGLDGNFYGTCASGGAAGNGTIYKITPKGSVTILHNFGDGTIPNDGVKPEGGLVPSNDGTFYGTASEGGSAGKGVVFRIKVP